MKKIYLVPLILTIWTLTLSGFDRYLSYEANKFSENFSHQNQVELAASDIFKLSLKLNIESRNPLISCLIGLRAGHVFYESYCASNSLSKEISILSSAPDSVHIKAVFAYPKFVLRILAFLLFSEALVLLLVFDKWREYSFREQTIRLAKQVAHDIRSPLTAITVISERLSLQSPEHAKLLDSASRQINSLAERMLYFETPSSEDSEHLTPNRDLVSLQGSRKYEGVESAAIKEICRSLIERKAIEFHHKSEIKLNLYWHIPDAICIPLNKVEFQSILSNLINNSFEATSSGFITITAEYFNNEFIFEVRDSGKGMNQTTLTQVGTLGFSYDKKNGSGLAINRAREVIADWGGKLKIDSRANFGTTVRFNLPLQGLA